MSDTELKPCPFCGGNVTAYADRYEKVMIECDNCKMYFGVQLEIGCELKDGWKATLNSKEDAVKRWNTRKPMDNIVAQLEELADNSNDHMYESYFDGKEDGIRESIDIVKRGGVEW